MSASSKEFENRVPESINTCSKEGTDFTLQTHPGSAINNFQDDNWGFNNHPSGEILPYNSIDQNFHRESVVCHSDARGVVHHGSSSLEAVYDSNLRVHESLIEVPNNCDQFLLYESNPSITHNENYLLQNSSVQRPRVIVAQKENCL